MFQKRTRLVALIGPVARRAAAHTAGYPLDPERMLPVADVLLLASDRVGEAMLFRYTAYGELAGDTWHASVDDAREQVRLEYGDAIVEWLEVPNGVGDAHSFAIEYAAKRINDRDS